jgi:HEPN domain-containing protein
MADEALAAEWLRAAEEDLDMAERALSGDDLLIRPALFHCEQAAEKALKSVLAGAGISIPRTHDLVFLLDRIAEMRPDLERLRNDLDVLQAYAIQPRYPGDVVEYTGEEALAALERARQVVARVRGG